MEEQGMIESRYACYIVNRSPISVDDKNRRFRPFYDRISTHVRIYKQTAKSGSRIRSGSRLSDIFSSIISPVSITDIVDERTSILKPGICTDMFRIESRNVRCNVNFFTCALVIRLRWCKLKHSCVIRALSSFDSSIMLILGTRLIKKCCFQEQDEMFTDFGSISSFGYLTFIGLYLNVLMP